MQLNLTSEQAKEMFRQFKMVKKCYCGKRIKQSKNFIFDMMLTNMNGRLHPYKQFIDFGVLCSDCFDKLKKTFDEIKGLRTT